MEPERDIEKELKAYAQQRRAEAGAPAELHPATRKLLQDEAARAAKSAGGETRPGRQTFWSSWQRLAVAGIAVVTVVVGCWMLIPGASKNKMEMARNRDGVEDQPADKSKAENKEKATATRGLAMSPKSSPAVANADSLKLDTSVAPVVAAPSVTTLTVAPPSTSAPIARPFAPRAKDSLGFGGIGGVPAPGSNDKGYALYPRDFPVEPVVQRFRRTGENADRSAGGAGNPDVLVSFRVEQAQEILKMIDSDGSVYSGFVARTPKAAKEPAAALKKALAEDGAGTAGQRSQPLRLFSFRVSGTNRTLKQEVVFTGNFLTVAEAPVVATTSGELTVTNAPVSDIGGEAGGSVLPLELQKVQLEGRVILDSTNKIEIEAAPVKP